jgi:hypothetical protein
VPHDQPFRRLRVDHHAQDHVTGRLGVADVSGQL